MNVEILKLIQQFLQRAQLTGAEVVAFVQCVNAIAAEIEKLTMPTKPPAA